MINTAALKTAKVPKTTINLFDFMAAANKKACNASSTSVAGF